MDLPSLRALVRYAFPLAGGDTSGPAEPVPRCLHDQNECCHASLRSLIALASCALAVASPAQAERHQGTRHAPGRARQPAGRLRPRRRPRRHRRPDHADAVHHAEPEHDAAADGRDAAAGHQHAAEERGRGDGHGQLPPFAQPGQSIDVTVSSIGNAKSLRGGTLLMTPLKGADGQIYAIAQGNLVVGGAGASAGGSKVQINHLSAGRIPAGATVERGVPTPLGGEGTFCSSTSIATDFATARAPSRRSTRSSAPARRSALDGRVDPRARARPPQSRVAFLARHREPRRHARRRRWPRW